MFALKLMIWFPLQHWMSLNVGGIGFISGSNELSKNSQADPKKLLLESDGEWRRKLNMISRSFSLWRRICPLYVELWPQTQNVSDVFKWDKVFFIDIEITRINRVVPF